MQGVPALLPLDVRDLLFRCGARLLAAAVLTWPLARALAQDALAESPPEARRAVVVGAYAYRSLPRLERSTIDAQDFASLLRNRLRFPAGNVVEMTDIAPAESGRRPTHLNLTVALEKLVSATAANSAVVVYFSGHGVRLRNEDYLLPVDATSATPEEAEDNGVPLGDVIRRLEARRPRSILVFLDASRRPQGLGHPAPFAAGPNTCVLYACGAQEQSYDGNQQHFNPGVFTYYLLRALTFEEDNAATPTGDVTFQGLRSYLQKTVGQYVMMNYNAKQTPDGAAGSPGRVLLKLAPP